MDHYSMARLLLYIDQPINRLTTEELNDFEGILDRLTCDVRQALVIRHNTPINTPTGSPE